MSSPELVVGSPSTMGDDLPLNTTTLIRHAARTHGDREIVYRTPDGGWDRTTYAATYERIVKLANGLRSQLGVGPGGRVGVLDWNSRRHFELYWAIPGIAAAMVQLNLRLGPQDLGFVLAHSETEVVFVDETLLPIAEALHAHGAKVGTWVIMTDRPLSELSTTLPNPVHYEDLVQAASDEPDWPLIEETSAYSACYTTGTTGKPKGVYYSHRSIVLHSYAIAAAVGMTMRDCAILITPMFHASGWGLPQAATLVAAKIILPGRYQAEDTSELVRIMVSEDVTIGSGAPVIFAPMLDVIAKMDTPPDFSNMRLLSGATEPPLTLMRGFHDLTGAEIIHAYGATETSPLATVNRFKPSLLASLSDDDLWDRKRKQGLPMTGVDVRLVGPDGEDVPHDGTSVGEVLMRGSWITASYHDLDDDEERFLDGFWRSGDVGTIDPDGYLKLTDRIKDVIKSGGEWISSIDMENALQSMDQVREAAVVGIPHPRWDERPLALVVLQPGMEVTLEQVHAHLAADFATWQLPDRLEIVDEIPRTSVGKINKKDIRAEYHDAYTGTND